MPQQIHFLSDLVEGLQSVLEEIHEHSTDPEYIPKDDVELQTVTESELDDLVRDLDLSKEKAELLASRLKQKNLLDNDVLVSHYRRRDFDLAQYVTTSRDNYQS